MKTYNIKLSKNWIVDNEKISFFFLYLFYANYNRSVCNLVNGRLLNVDSRDRQRAGHVLNTELYACAEKSIIVRAYTIVHQNRKWTIETKNHVVKTNIWADL